MTNTERYTWHIQLSSDCLKDLTFSSANDVSWSIPLKRKRKITHTKAHDIYESFKLNFSCKQHNVLAPLQTLKRMTHMRKHRYTVYIVCCMHIYVSHQCNCHTIHQIAFSLKLCPSLKKEGKKHSSTVLLVFFFLSFFFKEWTNNVLRITSDTTTHSCTFLACKLSTQNV